MPKLRYDFARESFSASSSEVIHQANEIVAEYQAAGFALTLRQVYYQFVTRGHVENSNRNYKRLGSILNDARMAGLIDWDAIEDRTRILRALAHWDSPQQIVEAIARQYRTERWKRQPAYVEVWIEKDALTGVIQPVCDEFDVPYFAVRGYNSQSEAWRAGRRLLERIRDKRCVILHLGDHDPSGIDMSRDNEERFIRFLAVDLMREHGYERDEALDWVRDHFELRRLALNFDQIEQYDPPPNPAKVTDSRSAAYIAEYGRSSWELDALEPTVIDRLIRDAIDGILDHRRWEIATGAMELERRTLISVADHWIDVAAFAGGLNGHRSS